MYGRAEVNPATNVWMDSIVALFCLRSRTSFIAFTMLCDCLCCCDVQINITSNRFGTSLTMCLPTLTFPARADTDGDDTDRVAINGDDTNRDAINGDDTNKDAINRDDTDRIAIDGDNTDGIAIDGDDTNGIAINGDDTNGDDTDRDNIDRDDTNDANDR